MVQTVKDLLLSASAVLAHAASTSRMHALSQRTADDKKEMLENSAERMAQSSDLALLANMYGPVLQDLVDMQCKGVSHVAVMSEMSKSALDGSDIDVLFSRHEFTLEEKPKLKPVGPDEC